MIPTGIILYEEDPQSTRWVGGVIGGLSVGLSVAALTDCSQDEMDFCSGKRAFFGGLAAIPGFLLGRLIEGMLR